MQKSPKNDLGNFFQMMSYLFVCFLNFSLPDGEGIGRGRGGRVHSCKFIYHVSDPFLPGDLRNSDRTCVAPHHPSWRTLAPGWEVRGRTSHFQKELSEQRSGEEQVWGSGPTSPRSPAGSGPRAHPACGSPWECLHFLYNPEKVDTIKTGLRLSLYEQGCKIQ